MIYVYILLILISQPVVADGKRVDLIWKARGLQAKERLEKLEGIKKKSHEQKCQTTLEEAFSFFASIDSGKLVQKIDEYDNYKIVLKGSSNSNAQLVFSYKEKEELASAWSIPFIGEGWTVSSVSLEGVWGPIYLSSGECIFSFVPERPLEMRAILKGKEQKK